MLVAGCTVAGALVEKRPVELARCAAARSLFCNWYRYGTSYRLARTASCSGTGRAMVLHIFGAVFNSRTRDLLLRRQTLLAGQADFHLPPLGDQCALACPMVISAKRHRSGGSAVVRAQENRTRPDCGAFIFYRHAFSRTWLFQRLSVPLFLCCRSLSILSQYWAAVFCGRSNRVRGRMASNEKRNTIRCRARHRGVIAAVCVDLVAKKHLSRFGNTMTRHA